MARESAEAQALSEDWRIIGTRARLPTRGGRLPSGTRSRLSAPAPGSTDRLNGQTVLEADQAELADVNARAAGVPAPKDERRRGYVALQSRSGRVEFRKVQIRE
jgi:hypothetical protein